MKKYAILMLVLTLLLAGLASLGPTPVQAYPTMGGNCALCHPGGAPGGSKTAPQKKTKPPTKTGVTPHKQAGAPQKQVAQTKQVVGAALSCKQCHPRATTPVAGMKCEACHEGGAAHMKAPTKVKTKIGRRPVNVMLAYEVNVGSGRHIGLTKQGAEVCAACHAHAHSND
ncbi:hypothetical protein [Thermodesulfitimonas sp.]